MTQNTITPTRNRPADLRDVYARIVAAREALDCDNVGEARGILGDLESDLGRLLGVDRRPYACRVCTLTFRFPGELSRHEASGHPPELTDVEREEARAVFAAVTPELHRIGLLPEEADRAA